jgi:hemoglobin-like flavoprotein
MVGTVLIKVPVVNRRDYTMYLELYSNMLWFHTDVFKWTPEVKKEYLKDLDALQNLVTVPLAAMLDKEDNKLVKFSETIGFKHVQPFVGQDNRMYLIYSRGL